MTKKKKFHILCINGPNLNLLGTREPITYGNISLKKINLLLKSQAIKLGVIFSHFQSNSEYLLIEKIHQVKKNNVDFIIINPAALTHTSISIRDALLSVNIPFIEIHISNIYAREKFRHHSYLSDIALGVISGLGIDGYIFALKKATKYLVNSIN